MNLKIAANYLLKNLIVAFTYSTVGIFFESFATIGNIVSPVFPPTGIAVSGLLLWGIGVLPGVWLGDFIMMYTISHYVLLSAYVSTAVIMQVAFSAWIIKKLTKTTLPFYKLSHVIVLFFAGSFLACLIGSSIGVIGLYVYGFVPSNKYLIAWFDWWLSDSLGVITMVTFIMSWAKVRYTVTLHKTLEFFLLLVVLGLFTIIQYKYNWPSYVLLLFSIWAAIRFAPPFMSTICVLTSSIVLYGALHGYKQFQGVDLNQTILFAQSLIAIIFFVALLLMAMFHERERAQLALIKINQELEQRVIERTEDLHKKNELLNDAIANLQHAQTQLVQSEKMSALGVLTAGIAHEINNSVNFISANINPLKNDVDDMMTFFKKCQENNIGEKFALENNVSVAGEEAYKLIEGIKEGAQRSVAIVKDLRTFSRLDEGQLKLANINENIDSTLNLLKNSYKDRIDVIKHYGTFPDIECQPGKLNQVFMNILMNAFQAMSDKGSLTITTSQVNDEIVISIKDTGPGMSKEVLKKIFEPFFTTKDVGQGTGLGLSISYTIIQEHHGEILVKSELGKGSEFIIKLPIKREFH